jgi:hypothetical protein
MYALQSPVVIHISASSAKRPGIHIAYYMTRKSFSQDNMSKF